MRSAQLKEEFAKIFHSQSDLTVKAPGRAEIIGNHTDYNAGRALGSAISQSTIGLFKKRPDQIVSIYSTSSDLPVQQIDFSLAQIQRDPTIHWGNYARGVAQELLKLGYPLVGTDILIDSNFPTSAGLSSSAALELCLAHGWLSLLGQELDAQQIASACQRAENSEFVGSPCGFLDQGTIEFAKDGQMVLFDFSPPINVELINANLSAQQVTLIVAVDKTVKRELGESGYPARRKMCEEACQILGLDNLSQLTITDFMSKKDQLEPVMRQRVEHVVFENTRVMSAVKALQQGNMRTFGQLLSQSGKSALDLFGLDEKTPELRYLMEQAQQTKGVLGARNMGGGFSATILSLVKDQSLLEFEENLGNKYQEQYGNKLEFIRFTPQDGVRVQDS